MPSDVVLGWAAIALLQRPVRAVRTRVAARRRVGETGRDAWPVIRDLVARVVGAAAFMLILSNIGISLAPILNAAGVFGVAVGFGAQSLVEDHFAGFFLRI